MECSSFVLIRVELVDEESCNKHRKCVFRFKISHVKYLPKLIETATM